MDTICTITLAAADDALKVFFGHFSVNIIEGHMLSAELDLNTRKMSLHWRGRETGENEPVCGEDNYFYLEFDPSVTMLKGRAEGSHLEESAITGVKLTDRKPPTKLMLNKFMREYEKMHEGMVEHLKYDDDDDDDDLDLW